MWKNPYYFFRIKRINKIGKEVIEEIKIDVTLSAWTKEISPDCKKVLEILIGQDSDYKIKHVLDFGCGKLTSAHYVLDKKKTLTVVDYKEILEKYDYLLEKIENLKKKTLFKKMEYPDPFIKDENKYDLGLLIHVLPTIPVFLERLLVISILHEKIRNDKYLLSYSLINATVYRSREKTNSYWLGDGIWLKGKKHQIFKTFFKYHDPNYLTFIMYLSGFKFEKRFKVPSIVAILYKRIKFNFLKEILDSIDMEKIIPCKMRIETKSGQKIPNISSKSVVINPYPGEFNLFRIVKKILSNIHPGNTKPYPNHFKRLCAGILQYVFSDQLMNMQIEDPMNDGDDVVDITFQTTGKQGFFTYLKETYKDINCPVFFAEAKNYTKPLSNNEFNQLYERFGEKRGNFGIILCRKEKDHSANLRQIKKRKQLGFSLVIDDKTLLEILKIRIEEGVERVNEYFKIKIKEILM